MAEQRRWSNWGVLLTWATVFSGVGAVHAYFLSRGSMTWFAALGRGCINWYLWATLAPLIYCVVHWLRRREAGRPLQIVAHLSGATLITALYLSLNLTVTMLLEWWDRGFDSWEDQLDWIRYAAELFYVDGLMEHLAVYGGITAACYGILYYRPALRASRLEVRLSNAKLQALQMQLQPHFLFNTLNSISILVHTDPDTAERMVTRLSELLRMTLTRGGRQEISLADELAMLEKYLEIELIRFQDRLRVERHVDPEALTCMVPALCLQTLVENSIRHGIARRAAAGLIEISAVRDEDCVVLEIRDDGPGLAEDPVEVIGKGVGLANTQERLEQLHGDQQSFELLPGDNFGLTVRLRLPFREAGRSEGVNRGLADKRKGSGGGDKNSNR